MKILTEDDVTLVLSLIERCPERSLALADLAGRIGRVIDHGTNAEPTVILTASTHA